MFHNVGLAENTVITPISIESVGHFGGFSVYLIFRHTLNGLQRHTVYSHPSHIGSPWVSMLIYSLMTWFGGTSMT